MSILIKGAKMPKSCDECDFIEYDDEYEYECWCPIIRSNVEEYTENKPASCPLVEIPPHGRLIDADKLMKPFCDLLEKDEHSLDYYSVSYGGLNVMINDSPTVIESEEQDNE